MILLESRELLDAFRRGEQHALLAVYRHYVRDVARFLTRGFSFSSEGKPCMFRGFGGGYEIEAALQEVFRRAFEERARLAYNGIDPYRPYLLRIARNAVINDLKSKHPILFRFRSGRSVILEPLETEVDPAGPPELAPDDRAEALEVSQLVSAFKAALDARERGVFEQRFEEGLTAEEVAARLGLSRSQVRTSESKLRQKLLQHLQAGGYLSSYREKNRAAAAAPIVTMLLLFLNRSLG